MKVGRWSTIAGNNNATPPDGWPEGQAPSTVNDCARENMAAIRAAFSDLQYFDQDYTPTQIDATSFSVPGNQTSAIHAGRRLKLFDASTFYATVQTASFTVVTTINVATDNGETLTSSLSSFGISVLSNSNNGIPRGVNLTASAIAAATLSVSATSTFQAQVAFNEGISVSATAVAPNIAKAFCMSRNFNLGSTSNIALQHSFNVASFSRSSTGSYRVTFTNAMEDASYTYALNILQSDTEFTTYALVPCTGTQLAGSLKFILRRVDGTSNRVDPTTSTRITLMVYR